ncbi:L-fucose/L-arabinose isomerase family protein [Phytohabitans sp. ZYX-F-186]|uniref:FucIase n=1 Tax=Phytohabitans maris TaxID=3071409 RepID=A0ABU0ZG65_9ACTN|nr:L-fucose/L-arabinose isomerase family protein [Phytohabitans sp. ZYX-F-186]MDQ7906048.1 L-fucose/L-arabinose isomerase family protein [Phytohabitans sp. ZYX-F-186]
MATISLLTFSDGRDFVAADIDDFCRQKEGLLRQAFETAGHTVVAGAQPVTSNEIAVAEARRVAAAGPDLTVFHYPVWAFPHFTMLAATATTGPLLLASTIDPVQPGMVGLLAAGGALDQIGRQHTRITGDATDPAVRRRLQTTVTAAAAVSGLRGSTFGRIGGRPMGMYTAASSPEVWIDTFGVDVEEIDQWEIVRRAELVDESRVATARAWLEKHAAGVHYDGDKLTPETLGRQIRSYYAVRELIDEWHLDFAGIKGQPELTNHFATMDVTEAFLNDPYDWDGPKETFVCSTESDMDGALTMQIMKLLSGLPVLFADVRHYHGDLDVWDLANSGQHATWYAARSDDPLENLAKTHLYPEVFFFPAGGASVHHIAAAGEATFARLSRLDHRYRLQLTKGRFVDLGHETHERLARASTYEWPHAFSRFDAPAEAFLDRFGANHIHAIPGDWTEELRAVCRLLDVDVDDLESTR